MTVSALRPAIARVDPQRHPEHEAEEHRGQADLQRDARAPDDPAQDVPPELVRPQQVALDDPRALEHGVGELRRRAQGGEQRRGRGHDDHGHGQQPADADGQPPAQDGRAPLRAPSAGPGRVRSTGSARRMMAIVASSSGPTGRRCAGRRRRRAVDDQVDGDDGHGEHGDGALGQRVVAGADGVDQHLAEAGPREDRLGEHGAGEGDRDEDPDDREQRDHHVAERVLVDHQALPLALGAGGADVVLADHLQHGRARQPADRGGQGEARGRRRAGSGGGARRPPRPGSRRDRRRPRRSGSWRGRRPDRRRR